MRFMVQAVLVAWSATRCKPLRTRVTFVDIDERAEAIHGNGIRLRRPDGSETHFSGITPATETSQSGIHEVVIIALKARQIGPALVPAVYRPIGSRSLSWHLLGFCAVPSSGA